MEGKKCSKKRYINRITSPFRAIYATIAVSVWEILSFGVLTPYVLGLWEYAYKFMEVEEEN